MTASIIFFAACGIAALIGTAYALLHPLTAESKLVPRVAANLETLTIRHCQHFPQMRRAIDRQDIDFMMNHLPASRCRELQQERRKILRKYLSGIADDFARLDQLARVVASLSPRIDHRQELDRFYAELTFRVFFRIAALRLWTGAGIPDEMLAHLANMVAALSRDIEGAMTALQQNPPPRFIDRARGTS